VAQFNGIGFDITTNEVFRFVDYNSIYSGYMVMSSASTTELQCLGMPYLGSSTGLFYTQRAKFPGGANRILLNHPNYSLDNIGTGTPPPVSYIHAISVDTSEAVVGSPVYTTTFNNTTYSQNIITTGTEVSSGSLTFDDDVIATVVRTGVAADQVVINWYRNGSLENGPVIVNVGNPVNETYTYTTTLNSDDFEVIITEG